MRTQPTSPSRRALLPGRLRTTFLLIVLLLPAAASAWPAEGETPSVDELKRLSLEELMAVELTSAGRRPMRLFDTAAAVHVLTAEDLRRAGVKRLPEALRMVPGVHVARISGNRWAVSIRGFNGAFANKLQVLVDGRSIYTPLYSGVFWDSEHVPIEEIERIEVIRGPGATLWGANAVNGIINIITRHSRDLAGTRVRLSAGSAQSGALLQHGGAAASGRFSYRVYGELLDSDGFVAPGQPADSDEWQLRHGGFRADWEAAPDERFMVQGSVRRDRMTGRFRVPRVEAPFAEIVTDRADLSGGHLLGQWERRLAGGSTTKLSLSFTRTDRDEFLLGHERDTFDLDFQHRFERDRHEVVWGLGARHTADELIGGPTVEFTEQNRTDRIYSTFLQDQITLLPERLTLTLGSKFEHNDFTGLEVQPGVRLLWEISPRQASWAAITRAVRTPSRAETAVEIELEATLDPQLGLPVLVIAAGQEGFESERLVAYEAGYRVHPTDRVSLDAGLFVHRYQRLRTATPGEGELAVEPALHLRLPLLLGNDAAADAWGAEMAVTLDPTPRWRLRLGASGLGVSARTKGPEVQIEAEVEGGSPSYQLQVVSHLDLPREVELDAFFYRNGRLEAFDIPASDRLDLRLGWTPSPRLELHLLGRNLLDGSTREFGSSFLGELTTRVERSVSLQLSWHLP